MKKIAELSSLTSQQIYEHAISLYRRNKKGDLEIAKQLGIELPKWESQYEKLYTDSEDCLKRLNRNYEIGIIANQPLGTSERLENLGVRKYIDLVMHQQKKVFQNRTDVYLKLLWKEVAVSRKML